MHLFLFSGIINAACEAGCEDKENVLDYFSDSDCSSSEFVCKPRSLQRRKHKEPKPKECTKCSYSFQQILFSILKNGIMDEQVVKDSCEALQKCTLDSLSSYQNEAVAKLLDLNGGLSDLYVSSVQGIAKELSDGIKLEIADALGEYNNLAPANVSAALSAYSSALLPVSGLTDAEIANQVKTATSSFNGKVSKILTDLAGANVEVFVSAMKDLQGSVDLLLDRTKKQANALVLAEIDGVYNKITEALKLSSSDVLRIVEGCNLKFQEITTETLNQSNKQLSEVVGSLIDACKEELAQDDNQVSTLPVAECGYSYNAFLD